jgi:hypothetical protein
MVEPQPSKLVVRVRFPSPASRRCRTTLRFISSVAERRGSLAFGVRVITTDGRRGRTVSHARTPEPHLARNAPGNFGRHGGYAYLGYWGFGCLSTGDLANPPQGDLLSSYTGWLTFVGAGLFTGSGGGKDQFAWEMASDGERIHLGTPIYLDAAGGPASPSGYRTLRATLCGPDAPPATYASSVRPGRLYAANYRVHYLELRPLDEPCDARRKMLDGVWDEITD